MRAVKYYFRIVHAWTRFGSTHGLKKNANHHITFLRQRNALILDMSCDGVPRRDENNAMNYLFHFYMGSNYPMVRLRGSKLKAYNRPRYNF